MKAQERSDPEYERLLLEKFAFIGELPEAERRHLLKYIVYRRISPDECLPGAGECGSMVPFVVTGELRASKVSESGREISMYSILPGETCIMNVACLIGLNRTEQMMSVCAVRETLVAFLPSDMFRYLYAESPQMQQFVFTLVMKKFYNVMGLVETLGFKSVGERLKEYIVQESESGRIPIYSTHAEIATRLGTSREVVTRKLAELEREGLVSLSRGKITPAAGKWSGRQ